jgi:SnoaL-like domain
MTPEEMVRAVFARVRACDPTVSDLYAADATLRSSEGLYEGREAIAGFYKERFRTARVQPDIEDLFVNLPLVVALLRVSTGDGAVLRVVDVFEVGDAAINSLQICMQATARTDGHR